MNNLGYEVEEHERSYEKKGLTGEITQFVYDTVEYPHITIDMTSSIPPKVKLQLLKTFFTTNESRGTEVASSLSEQAKGSIAIYSLSKVKDKIIAQKLGKIKPSQVKSIIRLFTEGEKVYELVGHINKDKEVRGEYLYVFAN